MYRNISKFSYNALLTHLRIVKSKICSLKLLFGLVVVPKLLERILFSIGLSIKSGASRIKLYVFGLEFWSGFSSSNSSLLATLG